MDATASVPPARTCRFKIATPDTLWNTFDIDRALDHLRADGYPLLDDDIARLSPFGRKHINVIDTYSFTAPGLGPTGVSELGDPDSEDD